MPFSQSKLDEFLKKKKTSANATRIGGKGSVRRKKKAVRKTTTSDDKRLKSTLQKLNVRDIPAIEEVNLFKEDGTVVHFQGPKVQASIAANTYVVMGAAETKKLQDLLPGIVSQLGPDNLEDLKKIYQDLPSSAGVGGGDEDDDDVPELVENFEEVAAGGDKKSAKKKEEDDEESDEDDDEEDVPDLVQS
eukprot:gb/GEZN01012404.1/.p1 GENE.gb/GEZN01012404.1/~~gb/GEZN01012404.1/.p1  ORF type:complete len:190 (-),score=55.80 gb/GEZN01012404.1/:493-1062(-)